MLRRAGCTVLLTVIGYGQGLSGGSTSLCPSLSDSRARNRLCLCDCDCYGALLHENGWIYAPSPLYLHALAKADGYRAAASIDTYQMVDVIAEPTNMSPLESGWELILYTLDGVTVASSISINTSTLSSTVYYRNDPDILRNSVLRTNILINRLEWSIHHQISMNKTKYGLNNGNFLLQVLRTSLSFKIFVCSYMIRTPYIPLQMYFCTHIG